MLRHTIPGRVYFVLRHWVDGSAIIVQQAHHRLRIFNLPLHDPLDRLLPGDDQVLDFFARFALGIARW